MKMPGLSLLILLSACCRNDYDDNAKLNTQDYSFFQQASYSNYAEISAGQIAVTNGSYDSIKMFGSMMIPDHNKSQLSLDTLANQFNVPLPSAPDSAHQSKAATLKTLTVIHLIRLT